MVALHAPLQRPTPNKDGQSNLSKSAITTGGVAAGNVQVRVLKADDMAVGCGRPRGQCDRQPESTAAGFRRSQM